jgi:hypothetical protein
MKKYNEGHLVLAFAAGAFLSMFVTTATILVLVRPCLVQP